MNILDNDMYKFTMMDGVYRLYPDVKCKYKFYLRDKKIKQKLSPQQFKDIVKGTYLMNIKNIKSVLRSYVPWLSNTFINYIGNMKRMSITISEIDEENYTFIYSGKWLNKILWEVPLLYTITNKIQDKISSENIDEYDKIIKKQFEIVKNLYKHGIRFADFGTRRRRSNKFHDSLISMTKNYLSGTSNVYLAKKYNLKAIGTMAHEWIMAHQVLSSIKNFERDALLNWAKIYKGDLGIALSDTINFNHFLNSFDTYLAKLFDGVRLDSGDPIKQVEQLVNHYEKLNINPQDKTVILSDGLKLKTLPELHDKLKQYPIKVGYGIGTDFTNPFDSRINAVIKLIEIEEFPVIKISNTPQKITCENEEFRKYMMNIFIKEVMNK